MKQTRLLSAVFGILLLGILCSIVGCAGSSIDFGQWAGNYSGSGTLDNNKSGVLSLTCDSSGTVAGSLVVTGADGPDTNFKFTAGTYSLTGSITSTSGGFDVNGVVPNYGNFVIRGQFPTNGGTTIYHVVTGTSLTYPISLTYTGTLQKV